MAGGKDFSHLRDTGEVRAGWGSRLTADFWPTLDTPRDANRAWRGTCQALTAWCLCYSQSQQPCVCSCQAGSGTKGVVGIRGAFVFSVCSAPSVCGAPEAGPDPAVSVFKEQLVQVFSILSLVAVLYLSSLLFFHLC